MTPLRVAWIEKAADPRMLTSYTHEIVSWAFRRAGALIVAHEDSPHLLIGTSYHPRDFRQLQKGRQLADRLGIPFLVGGHEAFGGDTLLAWADYTCVGEGYRLIAALGAAGGDDFRDVLDKAKNVARRGEGSDVLPDYYVPWNEIPIIRLASHNYAALAGRGCYRKCKFCMTTWVQPHQTASPERLTALTQSMNTARVKGELTLTTNDEGTRGTWSGSTTVHLALSRIDAPWPMLLRLGIEGVTEERRRWFHKPVADEDLARLIAVAKEKRRQLHLFFIIGWPDDPPPETAFDHLASYLDIETARSPRIWLMFTYFEPAPHTPLQAWDIRQLTPWDSQVALTSLRRFNARFRVLRRTPTRIGRSVWSGLARRMPPQHLDDWLAMETKMADCEVAEVCDYAARLAGRELATTSGPFPWDRVRTTVRQSALRDLGEG